MRVTATYSVGNNTSYQYSVDIDPPPTMESVEQRMVIEGETKIIGGVMYYSPFGSQKRGYKQHRVTWYKWDGK